MDIINLKDKIIKSGYILEKRKFFIPHNTYHKSLNKFENLGIRWNLWMKNLFDSFTCQNLI